MGCEEVGPPLRAPLVFPLSRADTCPRPAASIVGLVPPSHACAPILQHMAWVASVGLAAAELLGSPRCLLSAACPTSLLPHLSVPHPILVCLPPGI